MYVFLIINLLIELSSRKNSSMEAEYILQKIKLLRRVKGKDTA
jgi:hypothetical protein